MVHKLCIAIPIHKSTISDDELVSLVQCRNVLKQYHVYLVHPVGIDISSFLEIYPEIISCPVPARLLSSLEAYNQLKCSIEFYSLFKNYTFLLTYELDSYIFSDHWELANAFSYDYIGAPWFENYHNANKDSNIIGVGNSGFSMRNINRCLDVLVAIKQMRWYWKLFSQLKCHKIFNFSYFINKFDKIWREKCSNDWFFILFSTHHVNEDYFWSQVVSNCCTFKVADINDALKFSFEVNPSILYKLNQENLPVGCHAWKRYEFDFWKPLIKIEH